MDCLPVRLSSAVTNGVGTEHSSRSPFPSRTPEPEVTGSPDTCPGHPSPPSPSHGRHLTGLSGISAGAPPWTCGERRQVAPASKTARRRGADAGRAGGWRLPTASLACRAGGRGCGFLSLLTGGRPDTAYRLFHFLLPWFLSSRGSTSGAAAAAANAANAAVRWRQMSTPAVAHPLS